MTHADLLPEVIGVGAATMDELWRVPSFQADESVTEASDRVVMGADLWRQLSVVLPNLAMIVRYWTAVAMTPPGWKSSNRCRLMGSIQPGCRGGPRA